MSCLLAYAPKIHLDTQNEAIFEAGDTCSKAHQFLVSICQILWLS